jgi:hypothetical protein
MATARETITVKMTEPGLLTYSHIAEAAKVGDKGEPKFDVNVELLPTHPDVATIKAALAKAAANAFPGQDFGSIQFPLKSGDALAEAAVQRARTKDPSKDPGDPRDFSRGKLVLIARSQFRPSLAAVVNGKVVDIDKDDLQSMKTYFYPGCEVFATFSFSTYEPPLGPGVNAYVDEVFSLNRGTKLKIASSRSAADSFRGYVGLQSNFSPTTGQGGNQDIPL